MSTPEPRVALVTGASRGIGRATAIALGAQGVRVAINYRSQEAAAQETASSVAAAGGPAPLLVRADVGQPKEAQRLVAAVLEGAGRVDYLVNNAGIQRSAMVHKMSDEDWAQVMDVNLGGVFQVSRAALKSMRAQGFGRIVHVGSASSSVAQPGVASYVASKQGLIGLTKVMALENAAKGILVNLVAPGLTETDMVAELRPEQRAGLEKIIPLGRIASSEEVARMIVFVLTGATYSTGNVFHVSGGVAME
ncbi:MAG: 3-oxoacyl-ACP reductase family protein [Myxococcota bacterium]